MSVTEKTLKWDGREVRTPEGDLYSINQLSRIVWTTYKNGTAFPGWNSSEEAAKAAAQADYAARILSAIEVAPSPRAQALEEAAQALEAWGDIYGDNAAKCVRALSSQPVAEGWLGVADDTPRDTVVLLAWNYQGNWEYEAGLYGSTRGGWLHGQASHWRPLPASPGASATRPTGGSDADA